MRDDSVSTASVVGYMVVIPASGLPEYDGPAYEVDWDGELYPDLVQGEQELAECQRSGWPDAFLAKLVKVDA